MNELIESLRPVVEQLPRRSQSTRVIVVGTSSEARGVAVDLTRAGLESVVHLHLSSSSPGSSEVHTNDYSTSPCSSIIPATPLASVDGEAATPFGSEHLDAIAGADVVVVVGTPGLPQTLLLPLPAPTFNLMSSSSSSSSSGCGGDNTAIETRTIGDALLASTIPEGSGRAVHEGEARRLFVPILCKGSTYTESFPAAMLLYFVRDARTSITYATSLFSLGRSNRPSQHQTPPRIPFGSEEEAGSLSRSDATMPGVVVR